MTRGAEFPPLNPPEETNEMFRRWFEAERRTEQGNAPGCVAAETAAAETALRELMLALPSLRPRPGFAERVMASPFGAPVAVRVTAFGWPQRLLVGACLLFTGCAVALAPRFAALFAEMITLGEALSASIRALTFLIDALVTLISFGEFLGGLHDAFVRVVSSPAMMLVWIAAILFSLVHLRWLARLLSWSPRSSGYVSAH